MLEELVDGRRYAVQATEHDDLAVEVVVSRVDAPFFRLCHVEPPMNVSPVGMSN